MTNRILVMSWTVRGEYRVVMPGDDPGYLTASESRSIVECMRAIDGVHGIDPESIRFRMEVHE